VVAPSAAPLSSWPCLRPPASMSAPSCSGRSAQPAAEIVAAIDRLAPMLRFFRQGDGGLACSRPWEGDRHPDSTWCSPLGSSEGDGDGVPQRLPAHDGRHLDESSADAAARPAGMDGAANAGTRSFEMSARYERGCLVVTCGILSQQRADRNGAVHALHGGRHSPAVVDEPIDRDQRSRRAEYRDGTCLSSGRRERRAGSTMTMTATADSTASPRAACGHSPDGGDLRAPRSVTGPKAAVMCARPSPSSRSPASAVKAKLGKAARR